MKTRPAFIFVEKIGLHAPYQNSCPEKVDYVPGQGDVPSDGLYRLDPQRAQNVGDYSTGICWRVDRFFKDMLPVFDQSKAFVIYTSDHGQALYEGGYDATHCSGAKAHWGEGLVPLFVLSSDSAVFKPLQDVASRSRDAASHSDMFPTLLETMGFDQPCVKAKFGSGLLAMPEERPRRFFVGLPFRKTIRWIPIPEGAGKSAVADAPASQ